MEFSAYIKKNGNQPITKMFAVAPSDKTADRTSGTKDIPESDDYVKYTMTGIQPTADGKCKIGFEVKADPYAMTIVDDVSFHEEGTETNLAPNSGFEDITDMNYSSGGIISRQSMKYGYMETRARGARVLPGTCSAIWLLGRTEQWATEIDVLEIGQSGVVNQMEYALHTFKTPTTVLSPQENPTKPGSIGIYDPNNDAEGFAPSKDYHVYGLEWGPGYQNFYIDGKLNGRYYSSEAGQGPVEGNPGYTPWQHDTAHAKNMDSIPQGLLLSLGLRHPYWNAGDTTPLDTMFDVDYVRVWRNDNPSALSGSSRIPRLGSPLSSHKIGMDIRIVLWYHINNRRIRPWKLKTHRKNRWRLPGCALESLHRWYRGLIRMNPSLLTAGVSQEPRCRCRMAGHFSTNQRRWENGTIFTTGAEWMHWCRVPGVIKAPPV